MQLVTRAHSVFNLKAHIVFVVAYRRKAISTRILKQLIVIFSEVCLRNRAQLSECSGERDHVHLLISYSPTVCKLKAISSLKIRHKFHQEIKHMLWGKRFWTKSYCVISVGDGATTAIIEQYIKNQRPI